MGKVGHHSHQQQVREILRLNRKRLLGDVGRAVRAAQDRESATQVVAEIWPAPRLHHRFSATRLLSTGQVDFNLAEQRDRMTARLCRGFSFVSSSRTAVGWPHGLGITNASSDRKSIAHRCLDAEPKFAKIRRQRNLGR
jgi:hypothetical protein